MNLKRMLAVAENYFRIDRNSPITQAPVSIGTLHRHSSDLTVMVSGTIEFNSYLHRRDAWNILLHYNLYIKPIENGQFEAGSHNPNDHRTFVSIDPLKAITEFAYIVVSDE